MSSLSSLLVSAVLAAPLTQGTPVAGAHTWVADWDAAAKLAKDQGKDLFVDFTGSDWCGWCMKLHEEVFSHEEFLKPAEAKFILVALDYPQGEEAKAKVPHPERNQELMEKYGIQGFPTILLMTPDGAVFGKSGYRPGGPEKYVENLTQIAEGGKKALAGVADLLARFATAKGADQEKVVDEAITLLEGLGEDSPFADQLAPIVRSALTSDPENKAGRKLKAVKALVTAHVIDDEIFVAARMLDAKNADGIYERAVILLASGVNSEEKLEPAAKAIDEFEALGVVKDAGEVQHLWANAAFWNFQFLKDMAKAKKYAQKVKDGGIDNPALQKLVDDILGTK